MCWRERQHPRKASNGHSSPNRHAGGYAHANTDHRSGAFPNTVAHCRTRSDRRTNPGCGITRYYYNPAAGRQQRGNAAPRRGGAPVAGGVVVLQRASGYEERAEFSYHFVTFQSALPSGLTPRVAQLTWADHEKVLHLTAEQADLPLIEATSGGFDLPIAGWRMSGDGEDYALSFQAGEYDVRLRAVSRKPATLHHRTGLVDLGVAGKTYYYSRTRLETSGVVSISGEAHPVSGTTWMDHQWGDFTTQPIGWDWLSLNLDSGSDIMVSVAWEQANHDHIITYGTWVPPDSAPRSGPGAGPVHLPENDISLDAAGSWTSEATGAVYPMGWTLRVESLDLDLELTPVMEDAEFAASAFIPVVYWEGAVRAAGTREGRPVAGKGFVEMTGYAPVVPAMPPTPGQP